MEFTALDLCNLLDDIAARMKRERDHLCELDGAIGDADHGIAMEQGMAAAAAAARALENASLKDVFNAAGKGFLNAVGASTGPLYATAFMQAGKTLGDTDAIPSDRLRELIVAMTEGIVRRGKAEQGQKTMLDAWQPAAQAAGNGASAQDIARAAAEGAERTRDMIATLGRSARLGDRSLGHPDPGAVSAAMIIGLICERIS